MPGVMDEAVSLGRTGAGDPEHPPGRTAHLAAFSHGGRADGRGREKRPPPPGVPLLPSLSLRGQVVAKGAGARGALPAGSAGEERGVPVGRAGRCRSEPGPARGTRGRLRAAPRHLRQGRVGNAPQPGLVSFFPLRFGALRVPEGAASAGPRQPGTSTKWRWRCRGRCSPGLSGALRAAPGTASPGDTSGNIVSLLSTLTPGR